jgi:alpha-galactosidase
MMKLFCHLISGIFGLLLTSKLVVAQHAIITAIKRSSPIVYLADNSITKDIKVSRKWNGSYCTTFVTNTGDKDIRIKEVLLFHADRLFGDSTPFYAEGFQMLSQYKGSLKDPVKVGGYDDHAHYKLQEPTGYKTVYNMLLLDDNKAGKMLLGFNSCFRFIGKFQISADTVKVVMELDNVKIKKGETIKLEEFSMLTGGVMNTLTTKFAKRINHFHPRLKNSLPPTGWCSWYCFGPDVTVKNISDNLTYIKQNLPQLKYIQLDDGYQTHMGDWLDVGSSFGGSVQSVLHKIKEAGLQPAIWVAPFICDSNSNIFKYHADWLVKDSSGKPLRSDKVSFGGWRLAPWYVLDGTNPAVQQHLKKVFSTMYNEWGCTYFKLDANYWGAIQGGVYYDKNATRVTAYRAAMKAILSATGNAFILGCNHPLWPSLGLIHGSRSSNDIQRTWKSFITTGEENLRRSWQNGKLWWNDPDCILLTGQLSDDEFMYHAALIFATGGMVLSGDDLTTISQARLGILKKLLPLSGATALFNQAMDIGRMKRADDTYLILLNKTDKEKRFTVPVSRRCMISDYFNDGSKKVYTKEFTQQLPPHCGRVYKIS